jgi:hypothetical protein
MEEPDGSVARCSGKPRIPHLEDAADPIAELQQFLDTALDGLELFRGQRPNDTTRSLAAITRAKDDAELLEREAQGQSAPHQTDAIDRRLCVLPVPSGRAPGTRQQAAPFVDTYGVRAHARQLRDLPRP